MHGKVRAPFGRRISCAAACALLLETGLGACSLITRFGDVVTTRPDAGGGGGGAEAGAESVAAASGDDSAGAGMTSPGGHSAGAGQAGANATGQAGADEAGGAGATAPTPARALLAVAGTDPTRADQNVVSLIDPSSGSELARQSLTGAAVVGLAYDGANGRDLWFELTASTFPAAHDSRADLQLYAFADADSSWQAVGAKLTALPPPRPNSLVVLNDRLAYLSYATAPGNPAIVDSLTLLDTTDALHVQVIDSSIPDFGGQVLGLVGTRGAPGDPSAPGGTLAILVGIGCRAQRENRACQSLQILPIFVGAQPTPGPVKTLATPCNGELGFGSAVTKQRSYVVSSGSGLEASVQHFDPRNLTTIGAQSAGYVAFWFGGLSVAECADTALFTDVSQGKLVAVSAAGLTQTADLGYPGQGVVYEPFTQRAFTLFNPDNPQSSNSGYYLGKDAGVPKPELSAFDVSVTASAVTLTPVKAANFKVAPNLAPNLAAVRFPTAFVCN